METPAVGIILSTTRMGRFGDTPAAWVHALATKRGDMLPEIVDLRDYAMPFFDDPSLPAMAPPKNEVARRWGDKMAALDGYIFITAEYNHGPPGVLKNALDFAYPQYGRKPAAFVGYGGVGAARAIQSLRLTCIALGMAALSGGPNIAGADFIAAAKGKPLADFPHLEKAAEDMLGNLAWWARALKGAREA